MTIATNPFIDLPSVMSGDGIGFFDPHRRYFDVLVKGKSYTEKTSSYGFHLKKDKHIIARLTDQFAPFHQDLFGINNATFESGFFNGTVFRFPFRQSNSDSELSTTVYTDDKINSLIQSLVSDAHNNLLFLRTSSRSRYQNQL